MEIKKERKNRAIRMIPINDTDYPGLLRQIPKPPEILYGIGDFSLLAKKGMAVVGSRKCSEYGKKVAMQVGRCCAANDIVLISGMANGIDSFAHLGALNAGGKTIAVLGNGPDICYPRQNRQLYENIAEKGLLLSQFPPGTQPRPYTFPQRNRIIAALAEITAVIEAGTNSGALITAEAAAELGREVYAVPGNITSTYSLGCNKLLTDGALPIAVIDDLFRGMGITPAETPQTAAKLGADEKAVYRIIKASGETTIDQLCIALHKDAASVAGILSVLEIKGLAEYHYGKIFDARC